MSEWNNFAGSDNFCQSVKSWCIEYIEDIERGLNYIKNNNRR